MFLTSLLELILIEENFNPLEDIQYNKYNVMEFTNAGKRLENRLANYFVSRKEDNN